MVRTPPPAVDRVHAWLDRYQAEAGAVSGDIDQACAALVRLATTVPRAVPAPERDTVCRVLDRAWTRVLAAVVRACDGCDPLPPAEPPPRAAPVDRRAARLIADIDRRYADPRLTLTAVARQLAVSPSHLTHILKSATGRTFGAHLHARRIAEARRLLVASTLSVKEIACDVGYGTTSQLDRHFRKIVGCPPTLYRASQREARVETVPRARYTPRPTQSLTQPQK